MGSCAYLDVPKGLVCFTLAPHDSFGIRQYERGVGKYAGSVMGSEGGCSIY